MKMEKANIEYGDFWQIVERFPLMPQIFHISNDDNMFELVIMEIGSPQRHNEIAQSNQWGILVGEQANNHMAI
jgi:hypothetical protein